jgi:hypothetical protein
MADGENRELYGHVLMAGSSNVVLKDHAITIHSAQYRARNTEI